VYYFFFFLVRFSFSAFERSSSLIYALIFTYTNTFPACFLTAVLIAIMMLRIIDDGLLSSCHFIVALYCKNEVVPHLITPIRSLTTRQFDPVEFI